MPLFELEVLEMLVRMALNRSKCDLRTELHVHSKHSEGGRSYILLSELQRDPRCRVHLT
jgi:hypothetical protein